MTWYELTLRRYDTNPATGAQDGGKTMSHVESDDEQVIASVMRAAADRLDPPKPVRPAYRGAGRDAEGFPLVHRPATGNAYDARCRGDDCAEGHTYRAGCALWQGGSGVYAHDADCNTIHDAGPEPCPPPRIATPAQIDAMVCPNCIGDAHTYEPGKCALKPPWNGRIVSGTDGWEGTSPVVVDAPGARMDAPDAALSPAAAEAVARVAQDVEITRGPLAGMRQRRYVDPSP